MRKISNDELQVILENHLHWLRADCDGWEGLRADLSNCDLRGSNLSGSNLRWSNLRWSNLSGSDLSGSDLSGSDLRWSDLRGSDLSGSDLSGSNLRWSDLSGSDLSGSDLCGCYRLNGAIGLYLPTICPSDGSFTAWKKCKNGVIAKLLIPEDAKRSSATGRKCRASKAVVLALYDSNGKEVAEAISQYEDDFVYHVGDTVEPTKPFDENRWYECAAGIHFFVTREEAERY